MPTGTKVDRCFQRLKTTRGAGSAARICQASTGDTLATGKPTKKHSECHCHGRCQKCKAKKFSESNGAASIPSVEAFRSGFHRAKEYSESDIQDMADNFRRFSAGKQPLVEIPAVIGHSEDQKLLEDTGIPAAGWVKDAWTQRQECPVCHGEGDVDGKTCPDCKGKGSVLYLLTDVGDVAPEVADLILGNRYKTVSAEVYDEPPEKVPAKGMMLRRLAFLGGELPQIKDLKSIPKPQYSERGNSYRRVEIGRCRRATRDSKAGTFTVFFECRGHCEMGRKARKFCQTTGKPGTCPGEHSSRIGSGLNPTAHAASRAGFRKRAQGTTVRDPYSIRPKKFCAATKKPGPCKGQKRGTTQQQHSAGLAQHHGQAAGFLREQATLARAQGNHAAADRHEQEAAGHEAQHALHKGIAAGKARVRKPKAAPAGPAARKPMLSTSRAGKARIAAARAENKAAGAGKTFKTEGHIVPRGTPGSSTKGFSKHGKSAWKTTGNRPDEIKTSNAKTGTKDEVQPRNKNQGQRVARNEVKAPQRKLKSTDKALEGLPISSRKASTGTKQSRSAARRNAAGFTEFAEGDSMDRKAMIAKLVGEGFDEKMLDSASDELLGEMVKRLPDDAGESADGFADVDLDDEDKKVGKKGDMDLIKNGEGDDDESDEDEDDSDDYSDEEGDEKKSEEFDEDDDDKPPSEKEIDAMSEEEAKDSLKKMSAKYYVEADPDLGKPKTEEASPMKYSEKLARFIDRQVAKAFSKHAGNAIERVDRFSEDLAASQKKLAVDAFCEEMVRTGRVSPAEIDESDAKNSHLSLRHRLMRADSRTAVRKYSEGGKTRVQTELDIQMDEIRARSPFKFGERVRGSGDNKGGGVDAEVAKVEAHYEKFSEDFRKLSTTKEDLVEAFKARRKHEPDVSADQFLAVGRRVA